jgi:hypothetical protein
VNFFPLLGRGGHPFFLDKKGRKSQEKTKCSARFSGLPAHRCSEYIMVYLLYLSIVVCQIIIHAVLNFDAHD